MLTKQITYTDFFGVERTETFYFNLSQSELVEMQFGTAGGLGEMIQKVVDAKDQQTIIKVFRELILKSYGEVSPDGRRLMKSEEISKAFSETNAYDKLYMELSTDDVAASDFINGIVPKEISEQVKERRALEVVK